MCVCVCVCVCVCISFFLLLLLLFFFLLFFIFSLSYYLFKPSNYIITNIVTIMFINITVLGVLEKSSWGELQARNSSGMVYPYHNVKWWISRFKGAYRTHASSEVGAFCDISSFWVVVCHRELGTGCCESPTCVSSFCHYCYLYYYHYHCYCYCYYYHHCYCCYHYYY